MVPPWLCYSILSEVVIMQRLTEKQKKFVNEYLIDLNATQAAIRAGYSKKTAAEQAVRLLRNVNVQTYLQKRQKELQKHISITPERVIDELAHIAFDDIKNYLSFRTEKTQVGQGDDGSPLLAYDTIIDLKDSETIDTRNISEISKGRDGQFKFKLYCKDNALVQLGKHLGMFNDKSNNQEDIEDITPLAEMLSDNDDKNTND
jgi:phage terminase small subunit